MHPHQLIKITLTLNHALQEEAIATLTKLKSPYVLTQSARSATIPLKILANAYPNQRRTTRYL